MAKNVAVIGVGNMGKNHARIYHDMDDVNLVAVCDYDLELAEKIAKKYSAKAYKDHKEMLKGHNIDAISIVVPTTLHKKIALDVISEKIDLLIEKPIAATIDEAEEITRAAEDKQVKLMIGHIERFNPAVSELKRRISKEGLGKIYKFSASRSSPYPSRISDVGVVIDLAVHDIDIIRYLTGKNFSEVFSHTEKRINSNHEDMLTALVKLESDIVGSLNIDWLTPVVIRELTVTGEKGMYRLNYLNQELFYYENGSALNDKDYSEVIMGVSAGNMTQIRIGKKEPLKIELESFIKSINEGSPALVTGEDGLEALKVALKLIEASKTGRVLKI